MKHLQSRIRLLLVQGADASNVHDRTLVGLRDAGYDVTVCPSATEFRRRYLGEPDLLDDFDAICIDRFLDNDEEGTVVAAMIRSTPYDRPVVGIASTDRAQFELRRAGCDHANTPFSAAPALQLVRQLISMGEIVPAGSLDREAALV
jgi:hypothetical protein